MKVYELLKIIRQKKGIKQSDVAQILGTSQRTFSDIERGVIRLTVDDFLIICQYYDVEPYEILNPDKEKIVLTLSIDEAKLLSNLSSRLKIMLELKDDFTE